MKHANTRNSQIVWKNGASVSTNIVFTKNKKAKLFLPIAPNGIVSIGDIVTAKKCLIIAMVAPYDDRTQYPYPTLIKVATSNSNNVESIINAGVTMMYAGEVRCSERKLSDGKWVYFRIIRHTFITKFGRCIIADTKNVSTIDKRQFSK